MPPSWFHSLLPCCSKGLGGWLYHLLLSSLSPIPCFPCTCTRVPQGWSRFTTGAFQLLEAEGHHLWPLDKAHKAAWLQVVADQLAQLQL